MLRNGCLNLIHLQIPADVISEYTRLADILLYIVTMDDDDFVLRLGGNNFENFSLKQFIICFKFSRNSSTKFISLSSGR